MVDIQEIGKMGREEEIPNALLKVGGMILNLSFGKM